MEDVTKWLNSSGDSRGDELFDTLYRELKEMARIKLAGEWAGERTLGATALVHEAWLRLEKTAPDRWQNRRHYYGAASEAMRRILVESARRRLTAKRGGGARHVDVNEVDIPAPLPDEDLLKVHEALEILERDDETKAKIVKLRFFGGLNNEETGALLGISEKTVRRQWAVAKLRIFRSLQDQETD